MFAYFDNSATTKPCPEAVAAVQEALTACWGNPSSVHRLGIEAAHHLKQARAQVAACMGAQPDRVFFTSCGTEADNWAVFSCARRQKRRGLTHFITTSVEHHAILDAMAQLEGFTVTYLKPDEKGNVTAEQLMDALTEKTGFVSIMMVNNESGAVMPIEAMARAVHRKNPDCLFHTDAVQGFCKIPFRAATLGADLISVSGHKLHALKGAGALYIRPGLTLPAYLYGGGQEQKLRSGTEPMPAICAMGAACAAAMPTMGQDIARQQELKTMLLEEIAKMPGIVPLGAAQAPHIVSLSIPGVPSQNTINLLQEREIYVSAGSACSKGHRSHVLEAMGLPTKQIDSAIRISLSRFTTREEIEWLLAGLQAVLDWKR